MTAVGLLLLKFCALVTGLCALALILMEDARR